ncbi:MAG: hypothetical protein DMG00_17840 [Acidobacteria bacterium]|nr:MAG: hypothetical protein DMG00_17840 [Acidobacteriota bacterium]
MPARVTAVHPLSAIEGGRITIEGAGFPVDEPLPPEVRIGEQRARIVSASPTRIDVVVPAGVEGGRATVRVASAPGETAFIDIAATYATGLHQVDNPVFDRDGNLYVTYSGTRGQQVPVSIFRVRPNGTRETFSSGIVNPTSMAIDSEGRLYASSRFEGIVYRVNRSRTISGWRAVSRSRRTGRCSSAIDRARSSASTGRGTRRRSRRCRPASRRSTSRSDPTNRCT